MSGSKDELTRLKRVLLCDNIKVPHGVTEVLKSDLYGLLNSYFDINKESVKLEISVDESGIYNISVFAKGTGVKQVKSV